MPTRHRPSLPMRDAEQSASWARGFRISIVAVAGPPPAGIDARSLIGTFVDAASTSSVNSYATGVVSLIADTEDGGYAAEFDIYWPGPLGAGRPQKCVTAARPPRSRTAQRGWQGTTSRSRARHQA